MKTLRWGFLSTANIGRKNWVAIHESGNSTLAAIASRDGARSQQFIDDCQALATFTPAPRAFASYEALLGSPDVDAVYVPLPTGLRTEWVIRAAEAGKHVLCEKPCATSSAELDRMLTACRRNGVQFMDGVMFMHHPRLHHIRAVLDGGTAVGPIRRISTAFSFEGDDAFWRNNIRIQSAHEPAGCLGDLGWYCIRFALWSMGWQLPIEVSGRTLEAAGSADAAVPTEFSGELVFADGCSAAFYSSFRSPHQQWATVSGRKGWLRVDDFVHPETPDAEYVVNGATAAVPAASRSEWRGTQQAAMIRAFAAQVLSGKLNDAWPEWARKTQLVLDACLESARRRAWVSV